MVIRRPGVQRHERGELERRLLVLAVRADADRPRVGGRPRLAAGEIGMRRDAEMQPGGAPKTPEFPWAGDEIGHLPGGNRAASARAECRAGRGRWRTGRRTSPSSRPISAELIAGVEHVRAGQPGARAVRLVQRLQLVVAIHLVERETPLRTGRLRLLRGLQQFAPTSCACAGSARRPAIPALASRSLL